MENIVHNVESCYISPCLLRLQVFAVLNVLKLSAFHGHWFPTAFGKLHMSLHLFGDIVGWLPVKMLQKVY